MNHIQRKRSKGYALLILGITLIILASALLGLGLGILIMAVL